MANIDLETINSEEFTKDLLTSISELGLYTYSKTDLCDYIIYLANKHDQNHFFDNNSNADNARLLKVKESKIKSLRLNIGLKFKNEDADETLKRFLKKITDDKITIIDNENFFQFFIEDPFIRMVFESKLKDLEGVTLDYSFNTERVKIEKEHFLSLLFSLDSTDSEKLEKILKKHDIKVKGKKVVKFIGNLAVNLTVNILPQIIAASVSF